MRNHSVLPSVYLDGPFHCIELLVEARVQRGLPRYQINGLGASSRDTVDRIRNALQASDVALPYMNLTVNLSPVDVHKTGSYLDLSIALSILLALAIDETLPEDCLLKKLNLSYKSNEYSKEIGEKDKQKKTLFLGELGLAGEVRKITKLHSLLWHARALGFTQILLPKEQLAEAKIIPDLELIAIENLKDLFSSEEFLYTTSTPICLQSEPPQTNQLEYLKLNPRVQKALALSAAGWHSLLLIGPPGTGKSSIARELLGLLPPLTPDEALEIMILNEATLSQNKAGKGENPNIDYEHLPIHLKKNNDNMILNIQRPLRTPHHSSTRRALIGGGVPIQIGEVTRAHHGVLVLDELGEFQRDTLQALREPLENHSILLSRGTYTSVLPARFLLCGTTNPCPCGDPSQRYKSCFCTETQRRNYMNKFMGALRDRIDLEVLVERETQNTIQGEENLPSLQTESKRIQKEIKQAHEKQRERFMNTSIRYNANIELKDLEYYIPLNNSGAKKEWAFILNSTKISYRALAGIRKLSRTLADLHGTEEVQGEDILEAASYRCTIENILI